MEKKKRTAHRLAQLLASPRRHPFRVNLTPHCRFRVYLVDILWSIRGQRLGYHSALGGYTHLAAGSRTSGKTQVHQVPGDGRIPERVQPITGIGLVCLRFQAGQGRRDRQCQPRCVRMKYTKLEGSWGTRSIQDMTVRKRKHKVRRRCLQ